MFTRAAQMGGNFRMPRPVTIGPSQVALVATHETAWVLSKLTSPSDPGLMMAVASLDQHLGGRGTNYTAALRIALDLLGTVNVGYQRHIYMVADGLDNREKDGLFSQVDRARQMGVRIYSIPIGCSQIGHSFDLDRLYQVSVRTGGKIKPVRMLRELSDQFQELAARGGRNLGQAVAKVVIADVSPSMKEEWDKTTKIGCLKFALLRFLEIEKKRN